MVNNVFLTLNVYVVMWKNMVELDLPRVTI